MIGPAAAAASVLMASKPRKATELPVVVMVPDKPVVRVRRPLMVSVPVIVTPVVEYEMTLVPLAARL